MKCINCDTEIPKDFDNTQNNTCPNCGKYPSRRFTETLAALLQGHGGEIQLGIKSTEDIIKKTEHHSINITIINIPDWDSAIQLAKDIGDASIEPDLNG